jgi:hypothetical protein
MKRFAGYIYNKDESGLLAVVEADSKQAAYKKIRKEYGKEYKVGKVFLTERPVGKHERKVKELVTFAGYSQEDKIRLLEEIVEFWQSVCDKEDTKLDALMEKEDYKMGEYKKSGLPKKLGLRPIEPGSKYDLRTRERERA